MALLKRLRRTSADEREDVRPAEDLEGIDAFASEESLAAGEVIATVRTVARADAAAASARSNRAAGWVVALLLMAAAGVGYWAWAQRGAVADPATLTVQTTPPGLQVTIDGKAMGATPLTVSLSPGDYTVALTAPDGRQREFPVTLAAGASLVRDIEMAPLAATAPTGALRVDTEPARQMVLVDGVEQGLSPVTVSALAPGEHQVMVRTSAGATLSRTIAVREGETVSLVVSGTGAPTLRAGYVSFASPIPLELREDGRVVGTTAVERLILPAGEHEIEMINDALGFRETRRITIAADRTTSVPVAVPSGTVNINALPWAEVWIAGERIGETPIANLSRPIGEYEVVLRHPQFGERRARVTIAANQRARLGVDMRMP